MTTKPLSLSTPQRVLDNAIVIALLIAAWQTVYLFVGDVSLASPVATFGKLTSMLFDPSFWPNVAATMRPFVIALSLEIVVGVIAGVLLGLHRPSGEAAEPILIALYSFPKVLFYPVVTLIFGIFVAAEVAFGFLHGIFPIVIFTMNAVKTIKPIYRKTARSLRLSKAQTAWFVAVPAVIPEIFTGIRLAYATTLLGVLLCEMFGSKNGIGNLLMGAIGSHRVSETMALAVLVALFAVVTNLFLMAIDRWLHRRA